MAPENPGDAPDPFAQAEKELVAHEILLHLKRWLGELPSATTISTCDSALEDTGDANPADQPLHIGQHTPD